MSREVSRWVLGLIYLFDVALIWVASNFIVQSVISGGASPFLITYICNSLFTLCIPVFEIYRYFEDSPLKLWLWGSSYETNSHMQEVSDSEDQVRLLANKTGFMLDEDADNQLDAKGRNTSSLFAFLLSLCFLGEKFTWIKLISILLCIGGSIIVSVGDMESGLNATAVKPLLGDILSVVSASLYASFICIFRKGFITFDLLYSFFFYVIYVHYKPVFAYTIYTMPTSMVETAGTLSTTSSPLQ
ncbi:hypothetical protein MKX01_007852 [Papaver californicum]|nr:hypothetical protein MKX01_007852 [Papaver californicum]